MLLFTVTVAACAAANYALKVHFLFYLQIFHKQINHTAFILLKYYVKKKTNIVVNLLTQM